MIAQEVRKSNVKILVTGGSGFVGRNLTEALVKAGHEVTITSGGYGDPVPGVKKTLYRSMIGLDWESLGDIDVLFHQAANNDTRCQDYNEMTKANVEAPLILFDTAYTELGCKRFVYASSTAVYGAEPAPYVESITPTNPLNVYGKSKLEFEQEMEDWSPPDASVIGFRYCNVYGPGEDHKGKRMSMIGQLIRTMLKGKRPKLFEYGEQKRDWVYVDDVVRANLFAMEETDPGHRVFNMGFGTPVTFNEIFDEINRQLAKRGHFLHSSPEYIPCPFKDEYQSFTQCDMKKARDELGFVAGYDLRSGIEAYLNALCG